MNIFNEVTTADEITAAFEKMNVLIACEESQRVCIEFRKRGHRAFSCDIEPCSGGHPEWHIQGDAIKALTAKKAGYVVTQDGVSHEINGKWDLLIAHPPCTYLSNAGACRLYPKKGQIDIERYSKGLDAKAFFEQFYFAEPYAERICIENPIPSTVFNLPKKTQVIQPYEYGEPWSKKTYLWLKNLPNLQPTNILSDYKPYVSCGTSSNKGNKEKSGFSRAGGAAKIRSKTFPGIANAMAEQWGKLP